MDDLEMDRREFLGTIATTTAAAAVTAPAPVESDTLIAEFTEQGVTWKVHEGNKMHHNISRTLPWLVVACCAPVVFAQDAIQRGKIKTIDADNGVVVIAVAFAPTLLYHQRSVIF